MPNQRGYIAVTLIVFALFLALFIFPRRIPIPGEKPKCSLGDTPKTPVFVMQPPIHDRDGENSDLAAHDTIQGGPELGVPLVKYRLVRENVPVQGDVLFNPDPYNIPHHVDYLKSVPNPKPTGGTQEYNIVYPGKYGEITMEKNLDPAPFYADRVFNESGKDQYRFRQEGYIYYAQSKNGELIKTMQNGVPIYMVDFYQEDSIYNDPTRTYDDNNLIFQCGNGNSPDERSRNTGPESVIFPSQKVSSTRDQLQLEWFLFQTQTYMIVHCKPAIYLYPPEKTLVNVKVNTTGYLTYVDPPYDEASGWTVNANPDGSLFFLDSKPLPANYLYYESKVPDKLINKPTEGWVVKYEELDALYKKILPELGLNEIQTKDFIEYWNKALKNDSPYYFVGIMPEKDIDSIEPLAITPKPDSVNRVRIYFQRLDQWKEVKAPILTNPSMNGFKVVEWGGMVKNDPNHPFTCSQ